MTNKTTDYNYKQRFMSVPIENHETAAWVNLERTKTLSNVNIPDEDQAMNAKEYVDTNEK